MVVPEEYKLENRLVQIATQNSLDKIKNDKINIVIGDAKEEIKKLPSNSFNAIFFDPFSPREHKELWSFDIFKECYRILKKNGKLTTYSCATWIRNNMIKANFDVIDGPIFARKSASTIAIKKT